MTGIEWVEVRAPSIEEATAVGLAELGLDSVEAADIEVIEHPVRGFLGMGGQDAVIRVKAKQPARGTRRSKSGRRAEESAKKGGGREARSGGKAKPREPGRRAEQARQPAPSGPKKSAERGGKKDKDEEDDRLDMSPEQQAADIHRFLSGLLDALGLEGSVETRVEDGVIYVEVLGEQTEALVGPKGSTLHATLELCRTIIQRRAQGGAKIRLDIAGYNERRREALKIYSQRLADRVLSEGGEVMLEPMNSAERKIVHDTIAEIEGVRSYSEGEEPHRSVVIAAAEE